MFESMNNRRADVRDVEAAERMRTAGTISSIRVEHAGVEEHGLWLPDQVLGAYEDVLCGARGSSSWADEWEAVRASVDVVEIGL